MPPFTGPQCFHPENGDDHTHLWELPRTGPWHRPSLGWRPHPQQSHGSLARDLVQASHVTAPPATLGGSCLGEPQGKPSFQLSLPGVLPNDAPPGGPGLRLQARPPSPRGLACLSPSVSLWQSLVGPGAAALNSLSPLGTAWRGSIAKNQFQKVCQIPGNQASKQVPRGPSPRSSQSAGSAPGENPAEAALLWVNLLKGSEPGWAPCMPAAL